MRSNFYRSLAAVGLTVGLAASAHAASLEQIKKDGYIRGASANEVPYSYMDGSGAAKGIGPDVAAAVLLLHDEDADHRREYRQAAARTEHKPEPDHRGEEGRRHHQCAHRSFAGAGPTDA